MIRSLAAVLAVALLGAAPVAPSSAPVVTAPPQPATVQPARAHWGVQAADEETQRLIDRGLMMLYAFDVALLRYLR